MTEGTKDTSRTVGNSTLASLELLAQASDEILIFESTFDRLPFSSQSEQFSHAYSFSFTVQREVLIPRSNLSGHRSLCLQFELKE